jgi:hypothetical protein
MQCILCGCLRPPPPLPPLSLPLAASLPPWIGHVFAQTYTRCTPTHLRSVLRSRLASRLRSRRCFLERLWSSSSCLGGGGGGGAGRGWWGGGGGEAARGSTLGTNVSKFHSP